MLCDWAICAVSWPKSAEMRRKTPNIVVAFVRPEDSGRGQALRQVALGCQRRGDYLIAAVYVGLLTLGFMEWNKSVVHWFLLPVMACGILAGVDIGSKRSRRRRNHRTILRDAELDALCNTVNLAETLFPKAE